MSNNEFPLISVIVPVYNVEKYLKRCVDSIIAQSYPNLEIILVNDGSTDNSWDLCKEIESLNNNVIALSKPNGGLSSARNFGLQNCHGKYVGFIDSDDWIAPDMYKTLYSLISDNKADAAQISIKLSSSENESVPYITEKVYVFEGRTEILHNYLKSTTDGTGGYSVCTCLFPYSIAKKYLFRNGKVNEDIDYKYKVLSDLNRFVRSNKRCYFYFQSGNSISAGRLKPRDFDLYEAAKELEKLTSLEQNEDIRFYGKVKKARTPFSLLCRIAYFGISDKFEDKKGIIRNLTKEHRKNLRILLKAPIPFSRKILAVLLALNIKTVSFPLSILRRLK